MRHFRAFRQWIWLFSLAILCGCGDAGPQTYEVSGDVSVDNQPLEEGYITFNPTQPDDPAAAGPITKGKYKFKVTPGSKKVEITANRRLEGKKDALGMQMTEQYLPKKYNQQSELKAEITEGENSAVDFDLKVKTLDSK